MQKPLPLFKRTLTRLRYAYHIDLAPRRIDRSFKEHGQMVVEGLCNLLTGIGCLCLGIVRVVGGVAACLLEPLLTLLRPPWHCLVHPREVDELQRRFPRRLGQPQSAVPPTSEP